MLFFLSPFLKALSGDNIFTNELIISLLSKIIKLKAEYLEKELTPEAVKKTKSYKASKNLLSGV